MHRSFISTVVAAALAITSVSASMAQAEQYRAAPRAYNNGGGNEAIAGVLAGAAALFIIGKAIENNGGFNKKSHAPRARHAHRGHRHHAHRGHRGHRHHANRGHHGHRHGNGHRRHRH